MLKPARSSVGRQAIQSSCYRTSFCTGQIFQAKSAAGAHVENHANFGACKKAKLIVKLIGGPQMIKLFDHVGNYDSKQACCDAILYQTGHSSLQKKIIAENLSFEESIKAGMGREQGAKNVERVNKQASEDRVRQLEEDVRALRAGPRGDQTEGSNRA